MNQKEAVYTSVLATLGTIDGPVELTKGQRKTIIDSLTSGFQSGNIELSEDAKAKYSTTAAVRTYVSGLLNNWLRKDLRLNGGVKHEAKTSGPKSSESIELKALKALRKSVASSGDAGKLADVDAAISEYVADTVKTKPAKSTEVDMSDVPDDLKELLGLAS